MSKKYFFMPGFKSNTDAKKQQQENARELYQKLGSIKRTARELKCSKAEAKRILGSAWLLEQQKNGRVQREQRRNRNKQIYIAPTNSVSGKPTFSDSKSSFNSNTYSGYGASGSISPGSRINQRVDNPNRVVSTDRGVFEIVSSGAWGDVLVPVEDPRLHKVSLEEINGIRLIADFPKIPSHLWTRWIDLCFHFCEEQEISTIHRSWNHETNNWEAYTYKNGQRVLVPEQNNNTFGFAQATQTAPYSRKVLEVTVLLCRKEDDLTQWRMLIPKQSVSSAHVRAEVKDCIDLVTGERFDYFPPPGWLHAGSSHSHNTMDAFFSSTDDESELSVPGLHIVVGKINKRSNTYTQKASIVLRRLRKEVNFSDVVDAEPVEGVTFHTDVLEYISTSVSNTPNYYKGQASWADSAYSLTTQKKDVGAASEVDADSDAEKWRRFWKSVEDSESEPLGASTLSDIDDDFMIWTNKQKKLPTASELLDEEDKEIIYPDDIINYFYGDYD